MDPNNTDELQALLEPLSKVQMLSILLACARNNIETKEFITSTAKQVCSLFYFLLFIFN